MENGACTVCGFKPTVTVNPATAKVGETVSVVISIKDNPGLVGLQLSLDYDANVFELVSAEGGDALSALTFTEPGVYAPGCKFLWDAVEIKDEDIKDGEILILTFNVSSMAPTGDHSLVLKVKSAYDNDMNSTPLVVDAGKVTVETN